MSNVNGSIWDGGGGMRTIRNGGDGGKQENACLVYMGPSFHSSVQSLSVSKFNVARPFDFLRTGNPDFW